MAILAVANGFGVEPEGIAQVRSDFNAEMVAFQAVLSRTIKDIHHGRLLIETLAGP